MSTLPAGLTARPMEPADAVAAHRVYAADELADAGEVAIELADIEGDWARPSVDLEQDTVGVWEGETLVAAAEVSRGGRRAEGAVRPEHRGRGIGSWLLAWTEDRARAVGADRIGQNVPGESAAERTLRARGYTLGWTSWVLRLPPGARIADRPLPQGYRMRTAADEQDERAAYEVIESAFGEWPDRDPETYADWAATTIRRPGTEPWQLRIVETDDGRVIGACFAILDSTLCGYVHQIAVDRGHRHQGLAACLLADAFTRMRERGAVRSELATDSRTGALGLYEKVGMVVAGTWVHLAREL